MAWTTVAKIDNAGNLAIKTTSLPAGLEGGLALGIGVAPTAGESGVAGFVNLAGELIVFDQSNNQTTISPHPAKQIEQIAETDDPFPDVHVSQNNILGIRIIRDRGRAFRILQELARQAGLLEADESIIQYEEIDKVALDGEIQQQREQWKAKWITDNAAEVEIPSMKLPNCIQKRLGIRTGLRPFRSSAIRGLRLKRSLKWPAAKCRR